ncbi:MAG: glycosyltransferase family 2 protein [Paludibacteraceae bacterium]
MKVTIITATFNSEKGIQETIDSVYNQDYKNIEYIIIDGGSYDDTIKIIKENQNKISYLISEKDNGIYDAFNKGIKLSTGDIIGFLNSDDILADDSIVSKIVETYYSEKSDIVYGNLVYQSMKNGKTKTIRNWISKDFKLHYLKLGWMPPHPTLYCKKEIYQTLGLFDDKLQIAADYDFIVRVFRQPYIKKTYLPITMVKMNIGGVSNSSIKNIIKKSSEDYYIIKKNKIGGGFTLMMKNISKIYQFKGLIKKNSM